MSLTEEKKEIKIKNPNHLIYKKWFWMAYTFFSYGLVIFGSLSFLISFVEFFDAVESSSLTFALSYHIISSLFFFLSGTLFLGARTYWGRLLLYTRKQDRQNELIISAKNIDEYRQKEAERDQKQLEQMDKAIEAAVNKKINDIDERMESYTKQNIKIQHSSMNHYISYMEERLKKFDEHFETIARMVDSKASDYTARKNIEQHVSHQFFVDGPEEEEETSEDFNETDIIKNVESANNHNQSSLLDSDDYEEDVNQEQENDNPLDGN